MHGVCRHFRQFVIAVAILSVAMAFAVSEISEVSDADNLSIKSEYNIMSESSHTAELSKVHGSGTFYIPESVFIDGNRYEVVSIGPFAFSESSVTRVYIPATVTDIASTSFDYCATLSQINVSEGGAFSSYDGVLFDSEYTAILRCPEGRTGNYLIPSGVSYVGDRAFFNCVGMRDIASPGGLVSIGNYSFTNSGVCTIPLQLGVISIGDCAFYGCFNLTNVWIPWSVMVIGDGAFSFCSSLTEITVQSNNQNYMSADGVLFNKQGTTLIAVPGGISGSYVVPSSTYILENGSFHGCAKLESVTIGKLISYFDYDLFRGCSSLKEVCVEEGNATFSSKNGVILLNESMELIYVPQNMGGVLTVPEGVSRIDDFAMINGSKLTGIVLPYSYSDYQGNIFEFAYSLESIEVDSSNSLFESFNGCLYDKAGTLLAVPVNKSGGLVIKDDTTEIAVDAMDMCTKITSVTIPESLHDLETYAFYGCESLVEIRVSADNPYYASVDGVLFDKNLEKLLMYPEGRKGSYAVPEGVKTIADASFASCMIESVRIPASVTSIEDSAFSGCFSLGYIYIGGNPTLGIDSFNLGRFVYGSLECVVDCPENPNIMAGQNGIIPIMPSENRESYAPIVAVAAICIVEASFIEAVYRKR